jgi:FSR family fosmidomycin resistance protein-like MFS transporter
MSLLKDRIFSSLAWTHFIVDVMNAQRAILLAYFSGPFGLSNTTLGGISTLYAFTGSLAQPAFGYLADRFGPRWVITGGVFWMAGFFALAVTIPGPVALVFLVLASLGSAAFHPAGSLSATLRGQTHMAGRQTTAASWFFFFGQIAFFLGPILGGRVIDSEVGPAGLVTIALVGVVLGLISLNIIKPGAFIQKKSVDQNGETTRLRLTSPITAVIALAFVAASQAWTQQVMIAFLPKYLSDLGYSATSYGFYAALFMGASALGNVTGGRLADRIGKKAVIITSMLLTGLPIFFIGMVGVNAGLIALIVVAGLLSGSTYSVIVVKAQNTVPGGMGLATGLILGFMFSVGSLGAWLSGFLADRYNMALVFQMASLLCFIAGLVSICIDRDQIQTGQICEEKPDLI